MSDEEIRKTSAASRHRNITVGEAHVTSVLSNNEVPVFDRELDEDEAALAALGYKYGSQPKGQEVMTLTSRTDQNSSVNSRYGPPSASPSLCWVSCPPSPPPCGMAWDMPEHQVWCGDGSSP
jgi:hypothetical protein